MISILHIGFGKLKCLNQPFYILQICKPDFLNLFAKILAESLGIIDEYRKWMVN